MSKSRIMVEVSVLWLRCAPQMTFMEFIFNFSYWCSAEFGINALKLTDEEFFILITEYCKTLKEDLRRYYDEKDF